MQYYACMQFSTKLRVNYWSVHSIRLPMWRWLYFLRRRNSLTISQISRNYENKYRHNSESNLLTPTLNSALLYTMHDGQMRRLEFLTIFRMSWRVFLSSKKMKVNNDNVYALHNSYTCARFAFFHDSNLHPEAENTRSPKYPTRFSSTLKILSRSNKNNLHA